MPATPRLLRDLASQVSPSHVLSRPADLAAYAYDGYGSAGLRALPDAVVFPASTAEVADVVRVCAHHGVPVTARGAGTGYAGGVVSDGGVVLSLVRMSRILGVEHEAMRVHVEAGAITAAVHAAAGAVGLLYPPDPGSATTSTIGGNIACNASGARAAKYGTTADHLVGAVVVLADGTVARLGEAGPDGDLLLRLLPASEGTLAIVTEAVLRLVPAPAATATLSAGFADVAGAVNAALRIGAAGVVPSALEFLDDAALAAVAGVPGVGSFPAGTGALVIIEVDGDAATVATQLDAVRTALTAAGARDVEVADGDAAATRLWRARKSISAAVASIVVGKVNEDVCVPLPAVAQAVDAARAAGAAHHVPVVTFGHLGDGVAHATFLIDPRRAGERDRGEAAARQLADAVLGLDGSVTGEHGIGVTKLGVVGRQLDPATLALMRRIKAELDPHGLLAPHVKLPGGATGIGVPLEASTARHR